jgi:hypothetical protein
MRMASKASQHERKQMNQRKLQISFTLTRQYAVSYFLILRLCRGFLYVVITGVGLMLPL